MIQRHIVKAYDRELEALAESISSMGDFAALQFRHAVAALLHRDAESAQRVIDHDKELDALRRDVSASAAAVIMKRQPVAADLNEVLADFRVAEDLERVGDLAKNTAKRAMAILKCEFPQELIDSLQQLGEAASEQLTSALAAYIQRDAEGALRTRLKDEELDRQHTRVFREIVSRTQGDQPRVMGYIHLVFCAKNIERVGDHATHIAEAAYLLATGEVPANERRRLDESSSITGDTFAGALLAKEES